VNAEPQRGHFTFLPAAEAGTLQGQLQEGQCTGVVMDDPFPVEEKRD
jgi:hypothetical protein